MFAAIGYIVPEYFKWPGDLSPKLGLKFADIPNGLAAISKAWEVGRDVQHDQSICCDLLSAAYIVYIYIIFYFIFSLYYLHIEDISLTTLQQLSLWFTGDVCDCVLSKGAWAGMGPNCGIPWNLWALHQQASTMFAKCKSCKKYKLCKGVPDFIALRKASGLESHICDNEGWCWAWQLRQGQPWPWLSWTSCWSRGTQKEALSRVG